MIAIAEISGADSIAAALRFASENPESRLIPTYVHTGTEFGDFTRVEANVDFLRAELAAQGARLEGGLRHAEEPALWRALAGRPARILQERFGAYLPCVACHLYLHLMRIPIARECGATTVVSGEREAHGSRTKANQLPQALSAYQRVLAHAGLDLVMPLRAITDAEQIEEILGPRWSGGSPQLECVLKGNETDVRGMPAGQLPAEFVECYIEPVGMAIADAMLRDERDWDSIVSGVLARL
ncbi:MAG: hypothetical protein LLG24_08325 [Actinomycetia bacterium]|nr:hypothetical protein [Actinomycetes bacterium]